MVKFMPMRNRANCTANRIFLPDGSNFLQRSLRHNVTFFWICVICILMHRTSALFQIYSGKHSGFCTNQLSKIWEHERQSFFQKLSSQKRCNSRARHVLSPKKQPSQQIWTRWHATASVKPRLLRCLFRESGISYLQNNQSSHEVVTRWHATACFKQRLLRCQVSCYVISEKLMSYAENVCLRNMAAAI